MPRRSVAELVGRREAGFANLRGELQASGFRGQLADMHKER